MKLSTSILSLATIAFVAAQDGFTGMYPCADIGSSLLSWHHGSLVTGYSCNYPDYSISVSGVLSEAIQQGAKLTITAKKSGSVVYTDVQDFCGDLEGVHRCPVPTGKVTVSMRIPRKTSPINSDYRFHVTTADGRTAFCIDGSLGETARCPTGTTSSVPTPTSSPLPPPPVYPASRNCVTYPTLQDVSAFVLTPDWCLNKPITVTSTGPVSADIVKGATIGIQGRYLGRLVYADKKDLCEVLAAAGTPCPLSAAGLNSLSFDIGLKPNLAPN
ncbi:hypothetical protein BG004_004298, partial [Podila humilis]